MTDKETSDPWTGELEEFAASLRYSFGDGIFELNGYGLQSLDDKNAYGRVQEITEEYGISSFTFIQAMGIPTIKIQDMVSMPPEKFKEMIDQLSDSGAVPYSRDDRFPG